MDLIWCLIFLLGGAAAGSVSYLFGFRTGVRRERDRCYLLSIEVLRRRNSPTVRWLLDAIKHGRELAPMDEFVDPKKDLGEQIQELQEQRIQLWKLLDNIDTLDDACREHDAEFRKLVYKQQQKRFAIWDPDPGFEIPFSSDT